MNDVEYFVFLNDKETFINLEGSLVVGIRRNNKRANRALDEEDFDALFDSADVLTAVEPPTVGSN